MEITSVYGEAVPVTILTGFLGAGKTTLLNRILNGDHGLRVGVLVNDFGAINIDAKLVVGVEEDMISLANGCVCCQIRDDLIGAVNNLLARPEPVEYILLEASGVADPVGIYITFMDAEHRDRIRLESVTCVVDADQIIAHASDDPELAVLTLRQIGASDLVILNKADLAGPEQIERVRAWIDHHLNRVRIVEASYGDVPSEILLGVGRFDPGRQITAGVYADEHEHAGHGHDHGGVFSTWSYESDQPLSLAALKEMVKKKLPGTVYRCKGVVYTDETPERPVLLQAVGRRSEISMLAEWGDRTPRTQIVAIGARGGVDAGALTEQFEACLSETALTEL